jgi:predicted site-specific integrase-resolvase
MSRQKQATRREIPLATWARREGIAPRTAQRKFHEGTLPVPTRVTQSGRLMVIAEVDRPTPTVEDIAATVASLRRQMNRIERKLDRVLTG